MNTFPNKNLHAGSDFKCDPGKKTISEMQRSISEDVSLSKDCSTVEYPIELSHEDSSSLVGNVVNPEEDNKAYNMSDNEEDVSSHREDVKSSEDVSSHREDVSSYQEDVNFASEDVKFASEDVKFASEDVKFASEDVSSHREDVYMYRDIETSYLSPRKSIIYKSYNITRVENSSGIDEVYISKKLDELRKLMLNLALLKIKSEVDNIESFPKLEPSLVHLMNDMDLLLANMTPEYKLNNTKIPVKELVLKLISGLKIIIKLPDLLLISDDNQLTDTVLKLNYYLHNVLTPVVETELASSCYDLSSEKIYPNQKPIQEIPNKTTVILKTVDKDFTSGLISKLKLLMPKLISKLMSVARLSKSIHFKDVSSHREDVSSHREDVSSHREDVSLHREDSEKLIFLKINELKLEFNTLISELELGKELELEKLRKKLIIIRKLEINLEIDLDSGLDSKTDLSVIFTISESLEYVLELSKLIVELISRQAVYEARRTRGNT